MVVTCSPAPPGGASDLADDLIFETSLKLNLAARLLVNADNIVDLEFSDVPAGGRRLEAVNDNTTADNVVVYRRVLQAAAVKIDFAIQIPVAVFAQSVEDMNTAADQAAVAGPMALETSSGVPIMAEVANMRPSVSWEQYTADAQRIVLDDLRDCNDHDKIYIFEGPWNKNSEMFITIDVGPAMWDDPRCVGLDPHEDCQTSSFNEYRTKAYEGATVTLMTCGSTTQAGANLIGSDTALTTFSPLYATARDPATGERTIDVNDALAGIDPYDETEQARRDCVIQSILADEMPDSLRQQVESEICCTSGTYTPAALRQRLKAPADRTDLAAYGRTTVRLECLSEEGCTKLSFEMKCQAGIDCNDPESVKKLYAYGEWLGDIDALKTVETSTTSDAKLKVSILNTGAYDLTITPPLAGTDKPEWIGVDIYENNRPIAFNNDVSLPSGSQREFGLTFMGAKKPPTGRSEDEVFFPTIGASDCNSSKISDRQGRMRTGLKLTVSLETQEVPLTAIAIPSIVEAVVKAGEHTETEMALYNVQEFW